MRHPILVAGTSAFLVLALSAGVPAQAPPDESDVDSIDVPDALGGAGSSPAKDLIDEIRENMREIERLLDRQETGTETQAKQLATLETIDRLIEEMNKT